MNSEIDGLEGIAFQMGCTMSKREQGMEMKRRMTELQTQVEDLKALVNTLLSVICEEPDGQHSGSAPSLEGGPATSYCM